MMVFPRRRRRRPGFCVFPGYRYCGPGCSGPGAPINAVDAACQAHDVCYQKYGPTCFCDQQFLRRLRPLMNPQTREGRHAKLAHDFIKINSLFKC
ncbi:hypothetical protein HNQ94_001728 [Salirhabdus euzebyi]|uniref:Phospholipase A2-like domain-containing protein n=1 Tax=Salirhabdus euzebyi TaxID=394506 RepID=A0A841Q4L3_9BACI|nr:phospholipase [Salirhabdus euzebyi]MBB6453280.1 hypothetical protein [Salirhabdus euzebyi]